MKQYNDIKSKYPATILWGRVGDFYETFGELPTKYHLELSFKLQKSI